MDKKDEESEKLIARFATLGMTQEEKDKKYGVDVKAGKWYPIGDVAKSKLNSPGVYMIRTASHNLVLIGRTFDQGIKTRTCQHIHSPSGSNLNVMLCESSNFPEYDDNPARLKKDLEHFEMYFTKVTDKEEQKNVETHMVVIARLCGAELLLNK